MGNGNLPYYPGSQQNPNMQQPGNTPQAYGQQWNAAPNFSPNSMPNQPRNQADPSKKNGKNSKKGKKAGKKGGGSVFGSILLGILLMIILAVGGGFLGYNTAINARQAEYSRKSKLAAAEQYQLALTDIENGKYQNAKTRLDYVFEVDRDYPGAMETYQRVMLMLIRPPLPLR